MPEIEDTYDENIFFFGDIISKFGNIKEFPKTFYEISQDEERLFLQMGEQIYRIPSKRAGRKYCPTLFITAEQRSALRLPHRFEGDSKKTVEGISAWSLLHW